MAQKEKVRNLYLHTMLGRRGEKKESGSRYMEMLEKETRNLGIGKVVSVIGRYWALDREENWNRVQKAYRLLVHGDGKPVFES
jgi:2,3-bisphosphoglycerate-independent phosphoglycerate mutase